MHDGQAVTLAIFFNNATKRINLSTATGAENNMSRNALHSGKHDPRVKKEVMLSPGKKLMFALFLTAVPILFLVGLEFTLRAFAYHGNLDLVVRKKFGDREFFAINRYAAKRYFAQSGIDNPEPQEDAFEIVKSANTKRIFCLGESTMQGFPYEFNATAPSFLRDRLQAELPHNHLEVINVGLSAVGTFIVRDFIGELLQYQPDLIVVYVGHNEFYGVYQSGSAVAIKGGPWLTRLSISLLQFKTYLLLRDGYGWLTSTLASHINDGNATMMQQMVGKGEIPYESPLYREGLASYIDNLNAIISVAQNHHVPILFSTVVSSIRDQPPFMSIFSPTTSPQNKKRWDTLVTQGDSSMAQGVFNDAVGAYQQATSLDTLNASGYFKLGRALAASGSYTEARRALTRAKDLDALRFRASEEFNAALLNTCALRGVPVSNIDSAFAAASPHSLVGKELILEHLHPNITGYFLMAKTWTNDIRRLGLVGNVSDWIAPPGDDELLQRSTVSSFDEEVGRFRVDVLTGHWPFPPRADIRPLVATDSVQSVIYAYLEHKLTWPEARIRLGEFYAGRKQFDLARREYLAVAHVIPFSFQPLIRVADFYYMEGKLPEAVDAYQHCVAVEENHYAHVKLGMVYLDQNRPTDAAREIETAFALEARSADKFPPTGAAAGHYFLGMAYAQSGRIADARTQLHRALTIKPDMQRAQTLLDQLK